MEPSQIPYFLWVQVLGLIGLLIMDSYSIRSTFVDRVRKIITLVVSIIGCIIVIVLLILVWNGWDNTNIYVSYCCASILVCFEFLGWFFVRNDRGIMTEIKQPSFTMSMFALIICALLFFFEYIFPNSLLIGLGVSFLLFPFAIFREGIKDITPNVDPRKLTTKYERITIWNFMIDAVKLIAIITALIVLTYNGQIVLFPNPAIYGPDAWRQNLALTCFIAAFAMLLYHRMQKKMPLSVIILVLVPQFDFPE